MPMERNKRLAAWDFHAHMSRSIFRFMSQPQSLSQRNIGSDTRNLFPEKKGERELKQDCFDPNKFMVPFDYTDTEQSKLQKPQSKGIDAMLSKLTSLLDHINP